MDGSSVDAARRRARFAAAGSRERGSLHLRIAAGEPTAGSVALDRNDGASDGRCTRNVHVFRNGTRRPSVMGAVTARRFRDEGAAVVLIGRTREKLTKVVSQFDQGRSLIHVSDVTKPEEQQVSARPCC